MFLSVNQILKEFDLHFTNHVQCTGILVNNMSMLILTSNNAVLKDTYTKS